MRTEGPGPVSSELDNALEELGVTQSERELYSLSLASGPMTAQEFARHLGLQRPYLYTLMNGLRSKGLMPSVTSKYQKKFIVEPPNVVLELLRKKKTAIDALSVNFSSSLPKLLAQYKQGGVATQVMFYEGKAKFMELYDRILEEEDAETVYFGEAEHFLTLIGEIRLEHWIQRRKEKGVRIKTLMVDSMRARSIPSDINELRETRVIDRAVKDLPASFQVFGRSVIFWQPHTPLAVVLQDEYIAQLMRGAFSLLWSEGQII